jgi:hypothetical protein
MANLKWTVNFKVDESTLVSVDHTLPVERQKYEMLLQEGKKPRSVKVEGDGNLVLLIVQAKSGKGDSVQIAAGKSRLTLAKSLMFTSGISGISEPNQSRYAMIKTKPAELTFTNQSNNAVSIEIQSFWEVKIPKKKAAGTANKAAAASRRAKQNPPVSTQPTVGSSAPQP